MSANQSNNATTYYGDYMFKKKYKEFNNLEFVGGYFLHQLIPILLPTYIQGQEHLTIAC